MTNPAPSTAPAGDQNNEHGQEQPKGFEAITSQEDFDKAIQARIARERAKIPTDYDELKAKAAKFAEWEESQKTASQKAIDRAEAAEKRAAELETRTVRAEVAAAKGIPAELLTGSTREELEASADALIAFKGDPQPQRLYIPSEGGQPALALNGDGIEAALRNKLGIK